MVGGAENPYLLLHISGRVINREKYIIYLLYSIIINEFFLFSEEWQAFGELAAISDGIADKQTDRQNNLKRSLCAKKKGLQLDQLCFINQDLITMVDKH